MNARNHTITLLTSIFLLLLAYLTHQTANADNPVESLELRCGAGPFSTVRRWCRATAGWATDSLCCEQVLHRAQVACSTKVNVPFIGGQPQRVFVETFVPVEMQFEYDFGSGTKVYTHIVNTRLEADQSARDLCATHMAHDNNQHGDAVRHALVVRCQDLLITNIRFTYKQATSSKSTTSMKITKDPLSSADSSHLNAGFRREELIAVLKLKLTQHGKSAMPTTVVLNLSNKGFIKWIPGWVRMILSFDGVSAPSSFGNNNKNSSSSSNNNSNSNSNSNINYNNSRAVYLIVAMDGETQSFCDQENYACVRWRGPPEAYLGTMKLAATRDLLALGVDVLCSEMDVLWVTNPLLLLGANHVPKRTKEKNIVRVSVLPSYKKNLVREGDAIQWNPEICHWCQLQNGWRPNKQAHHLIRRHIRGEEADLQFSSHALVPEVNIGFYLARAAGGHAEALFAGALTAMERACNPDTMSQILDLDTPSSSSTKSQTVNAKGWPVDTCAKVYNSVKNWRLDQFIIDQVLPGSSRRDALSPALQTLLGIDSTLAAAADNILWKKLDYNVFGSGDGVDGYTRLCTVHAFQPMNATAAMMAWFDDRGRGNTDNGRMNYEKKYPGVAWAQWEEEAMTMSERIIPPFLPQLLPVAIDDGIGWLLQGLSQREPSCHALRTSTCLDATNKVSTTSSMYKKNLLRIISPREDEVLFAGANLKIDIRLVGPYCQRTPGTLGAALANTTLVTLCFAVSSTQWLYTVQSEYYRVLESGTSQHCRNATLTELCSPVRNSVFIKMGEEWSGRTSVQVTAATDGGGLSLFVKRNVEVMPI